LLVDGALKRTGRSIRRWKASNPLEDPCIDRASTHPVSAMVPCHHQEPGPKRSTVIGAASPPDLDPYLLEQVIGLVLGAGERAHDVLDERTVLRDEASKVVRVTIPEAAAVDQSS
jgi:hypothetical protein